MGRNKKRHKQPVANNVSKPATERTGPVMAPAAAAVTGTRNTGLKQKIMGEWLQTCIVNQNVVECLDKAHCQKHIIGNFDEAIRHPKFVMLPKEDMVVFLQSSDLVVSGEEAIYDAVMKWVKHDLGERKQHMDDLLELVRFPQLDLGFLGKKVVRESLILYSTVGQKLLEEAFDFHQNKIQEEYDYEDSLMLKKVCSQIGM